MLAPLDLLLRTLAALDTKLRTCKEASGACADGGRHFDCPVECPCYKSLTRELAGASCTVGAPRRAWEAAQPDSQRNQVFACQHHRAAHLGPLFGCHAAGLVHQEAGTEGARARQRGAVQRPPAADSALLQCPNPSFRLNMADCGPAVTLLSNGWRLNRKLPCSNHVLAPPPCVINILPAGLTTCQGLRDSGPESSAT